MRYYVAHLGPVKTQWNALCFMNEGETFSLEEAESVVESFSIKFPHIVYFIVPASTEE